VVWEVEEDVSSDEGTYGREKILETGSTSSHSLGNSLWKSLWLCRETDCMLMGCQ
jgi:hypothetical protein